MGIQHLYVFPASEQLPLTLSCTRFAQPLMMNQTSWLDLDITVAWFVLTAIYPLPDRQSLPIVNTRLTRTEIIPSPPVQSCLVSCPIDYFDLHLASIAFGTLRKNGTLKEMRR